MLRIHQSVSAAEAKSYYTQSLGHADYYVQGQEIAGHWHGALAARLGLSGPVTREAFHALCDNRDPSTGRTLTARQKDDRRPGYDLTFSAPKSVALLYAMTNDARILAAFDAASNATMREIEAEMRTRVRRSGQDTDRVTGNAVYADFTHFTTRPVDGQPDPDLHRHYYLFNVTLDPVEQRYKAAQLGDIKRDAGYFEAAFHARLAAGLSALGFRIERHGEKWWDVAGIPREMIERFSRRSAEIQAKAAALGITDPDAKGALGARTRQGKDTSLDLEELRGLWGARMSMKERLQLEAVVRAAAVGERSPPIGERVTPATAMDFALAHAFERASVTSEKQLLASALWRGCGVALPEQLIAELARPEMIAREVEGRRLVTTRPVMAQEQAMIAYARQGRGMCAMLGTGRHAFQDTRLNAQQRAAVKHLLNSRDRVIAVRGGAGTGKSTLLKEAVAGIEEGGCQVGLFAPTAAAVDVLKSDGFQEAATVQRLLVDPELQAAMRGGVILIDEAGLVGVPTLARVFRIAEAVGARVILSGDTRQHTAVERGDAMRLLERSAGLPVAEVQTILRQTKVEYRDAVAAVARGDAAGGLARLDALGWVTEGNMIARNQALVCDYLAAIGAGKTVLIVAPTHREGEAATRLVREALQATGRLGSEERTVSALRDLRFTEAEKADPYRYQPGMVVEFHQHARAIKSGTRLRVTRIDDLGRVVAVDGRGRAHALPLDTPGRFTVYQPHALALAPGDLVRITRNTTSLDGHKLARGNVYRLAGFTKTGDLRIEAGREEWCVSADHGHLAHGYVATSYAAQGRTVDQVFLLQTAQSLPATFAEQFYVSLSRGRERVRIYTDDRQGLLAAVARSSQRGSATELLEGQLDRDSLKPRVAARRRQQARTQRYAAYLEEQLGDVTADSDGSRRGRDVSART
ncbi:MobF family relaxase [Roseicella sp. DB1501]|uniref:MobF family relaxase n=1 Tax=Roseicella sp. DB1501 TaxID=2730925 RepID=UPI001491E7A4|nr:MobF family relaxase [Roseicella sp. DB1501]NOG73580.1 relaxase domain-containing protein [Roseicella sp. DB1501]